MALRDELKGLNDAFQGAGQNGESLVKVFEDLIIKAAQLKNAGASFTNDFAESINDSVKASEKFSLMIERIKKNSISNREINNQIAKSQDRLNKFTSQAALLQKELNKIRIEGTEEEKEAAKARQQSLLEQIDLVGKVTEAERKYLELTQASLEARIAANDKTKEFYKTLGDTISLIPGLSPIGDLFNQVGEAIAKAQMEGKGLMGVLLGVGNVLAGAFLAVFVKSMFEVNKEITEFGKNLNLSKEEAIDLKREFKAISDNVNDITINSVRLGKANAALNEQLGTAFVFSGEILTTFSKLTEIVGLSSEAAGSLAFQAQLSGKSFREIEENTLAASYSLQRAYGVQLNQREVLEATGKVTGRVRANLGANPEAIARAVTQAKLFGAELDDIVDAGESLLDFESSIENELKAELITGKQLNLERARALALAGDQESLARELESQAGSFSEFSALNVLQQKELAAAFGMTSDQLSDILFKQETQNMNAKQLRALGKDELADRLEQVSAQDKIALAMEKFNVLMGELAVAFTPIIEGFASLVSNGTMLKAIIATLVSVSAVLALNSIVTAVASLFSTLGLIPGVGVLLAAAAVGVMMASISSAKQKVADGIAPSSKGPFTITDKYGAMAVTAKGDNLAVSPNINKGNSSPQPVVIHNTFSNFKSAAYNQLADTQMRQATPTFV
jgi:hypothetical protein